MTAENLFSSVLLFDWIKLAIWIRDLVKALQVIQEAGWSQDMR